MKLRNSDGDVVVESTNIKYDDALRGWVTDSGVFSDPDKVLVLEMPPNKKVSPIEFKLLFTAQERLAIKVARESDLVIDDFFDIVDDPRLTYVDLGLQSTQQALAYLESKDLLTAERVAQILTGVVQ